MDRRKDNEKWNLGKENPYHLEANAQDIAYLPKKKSVKRDPADTGTLRLKLPVSAGFSFLRRKYLLVTHVFRQAASLLSYNGFPRLMTVTFALGVSLAPLPQVNFTVFRPCRSEGAAPFGFTFARTSPFGL